MSVAIVNNQITITRGDSISVAIPLKQTSGEEYILQNGDKAYFCIKHTVEDKEYAVLKEFTGNGHDIIRFKLEAGETKRLSQKVYAYEVSVELDRGEGEERFVRTVIDKTRFALTDELY